MKRYLPIIIISAALLAAVAAGYFLFKTEEPRTVATPSPTLGLPAPAAPTQKRDVVTVEEFGDYQCPPCGAIHPDLKKIKAEYGERIKFIFYQFPIPQIHKNAKPAAMAAVAAGQQGKFWEMHNMLYDNQTAWSETDDLRPIVINFARQIGLDVNRFTRDLDSIEVETKVVRDLERAKAMGVNSTPTIFVDGQMLKNESLSLEYIRQEIDSRLSR